MKSESEIITFPWVSQNYHHKIIYYQWHDFEYVSYYYPATVLKRSMKGKLLDKFEYRENTDDRLCIIACLGKYHSRQNNLEGLKPYQLIVIFKKLFKGVYTDIMRRRRKDLFALKISLIFSTQMADCIKRIHVDEDESIR